MQAAAATEDEARRLAILRRLGILDSADEDSFNGLVECAAQVLNMPIALISLIDGHRQWFKAAASSPRAPRTISTRVECAAGQAIAGARSGG